MRLNQFAGLRFARNDGGGFVLARRDGVIEMVEAQAGFARGGIRAVAGEAIFRKDGADVAVVFYLGGRGRGEELVMRGKNEHKQ